MEDSGPWVEYGEEEMAWLSRRDKKLGKVIAARGLVRRTAHPDPFTALLRAVIGQQISGKAQESIWSRFKNSFYPLVPANVATIELEAMRACGISLRKAGYLRGIAAEFAKGSLAGVNLGALEDADLQSRLLKLKGIGPWTVEMLLIFTFQRKNVLSFGDLGIQRGMAQVYGHEKITPEIFTKHYKRYSPFATVAGIYLWEVAGGFQAR